MINNSDEYNFDFAFHYKAYRPPLHKIILDRCLEDKTFEIAFDVGCGVGNSSIALTSFCKKVVGYDPSNSMIQSAIFHEKVNYISNLQDFKLKYDLLCFFGSLFYVDNKDFEFYIDNLISEGSIICCDFKIIYQYVLDDIGISVKSSNYNHKKNLDENNNKQIELISTEHFTIDFQCQPDELSHLLMSENNIKEELIKYLNTPDLYQSLLKKLEKLYSSNKIKLKAEMYYSYYKKRFNQ